MNHKVLLVDDDPLVLSGLRRSLGERFNLHCATSGEAALALVRSQGPFAAVISDMRMPGMSGLDLLREMRKTAPETVRLVLSGHADFDVAVAAVNEGAIFRFHTKPVSPEVLTASLECALLRHQEERLAGGRIDPGESLIREVADLRDAFAGHQFRLYLQPQCRVGTGETVGAEALVRWQHPQRGLLQPGQFLAAAEAADLLGNLTTYMLDATCAQLGRWRDLDLPALRIAVNGTPKDFCDLAFPERVLRILESHGTAANQIELEITEGAAIEDVVNTRMVLQSLADAGVHSSIDDFGTGHASLGWLRQLPVHKLKIDRVFVEDIVGDPLAYRLLRNIVAMAHDLGLTVLAEGVETPEQMELMQSAGCDMVQGFLLARPMPAEDFPGWLAQRQQGLKHTA